MNNKINFISDIEVEPVEFIKKLTNEYTQVVRSLDVHLNSRRVLSKKWDDIVDDPEYVLIEDNGSFKIRAKTDRIILVTVDNKELAENIIILMNLAFREGAKQIIRVLETL
ncbi:MAG: hypothetical protein PHF86_05260 [Candidatus Nanoarchaeia archaeon]|jgi:hypothetical protein|nr:hypothetical protein [Candidatus Nanoarchaeia archaeon]